MCSLKKLLLIILYKYVINKCLYLNTKLCNNAKRFSSNNFNN